jgi:hypothetical protein
VTVSKSYLYLIDVYAVGIRKITFPVVLYQSVNTVPGKTVLMIRLWRFVGRLTDFQKNNEKIW